MYPTDSHKQDRTSISKDKEIDYSTPEYERSSARSIHGKVRYSKEAFRKRLFESRWFHITSTLKMRDIHSALFLFGNINQFFLMMILPAATMEEGTSQWSYYSRWPQHYRCGVWLKLQFHIFNAPLQSGELFACFQFRVMLLRIIASLEIKEEKLIVVACSFAVKAEKFVNEALRYWVSCLHSLMSHNRGLLRQLPILRGIMSFRSLAPRNAATALFHPIRLLSDYWQSRYTKVPIRW